jgi:ATP-dependent Clp protease ATP-binding subunit ClpC
MEVNTSFGASLAVNLMFEKYTEKARRTIFFARYEVTELGGQAIGPEHLLLGLLREDKSLIPRLFREQDETVRDAVWRRLEEHSRVGEKISDSVEVALTEEAKNVLWYAAEESEGMGHRHIGTEHLLLGLLRAKDSFAASVLREQGIGYEAVREALEEMYGE